MVKKYPIDFLIVYLIAKGLKPVLTIILLVMELRGHSKMDDNGKLQSASFERFKKMFSARCLELKIIQDPI